MNSILEESHHLPLIRQRADTAMHDAGISMPSPRSNLVSILSLCTEQPVSSSKLQAAVAEQNPANLQLAPKNQDINVDVSHSRLRL